MTRIFEAFEAVTLLQQSLCPGSTWTPVPLGGVRLSWRLSLQLDRRLDAPFALQTLEDGCMQNKDRFGLLWSSVAVKVQDADFSAPLPPWSSVSLHQATSASKRSNKHQRCLRARKIMGISFPPYIFRYGRFSGCVALGGKDALPVAQVHVGVHPSLPSHRHHRSQLFTYISVKN